MVGEGDGYEARMNLIRRHEREREREREKESEKPWSDIRKMYNVSEGDLFS